MNSTTTCVFATLCALWLASAGFAQMASVTVPGTPAISPACLAAPPGMVSWWPGDSNEKDVLGGNNPSSVSGVTLVPGEVLDGFTFGSGGYIRIPAAENLANQQFTWAAWAEPDGPGPTNDVYGSVIIVQDTDQYNDVVALDWSAQSNKFNFVFGNQAYETIFSQDAFPAGTFYFVAGTYDGTTFQLYVNGTLEGSYSETKTIVYSSLPWMIGSADPNIVEEGYPRTWNGVIDEVQAYNTVLSQSQIQAIYNAGSGGVCKGLAFSPASVSFSRRPVGSTSPPAVVTATNQFPAPVTVNKITASDEFAQTNACPVPPATLASGASCTVSVTFTPTETGTQKGRLTIAGSAPASPQTVALTGAATDISLSQAKLNFENHKVGTTTHAQTVTATNVGIGVVDFTGSGIVLAGADPGDFVISANSCGPSLAGGASCNVSIEFEPMEVGTRNATLQFNDNGGARPQTVALTGKGLAATSQR
jgi:concanavalin A-like lectin/glucanase superfamily protein/ASPM-SPD-2-Hydin domain-containing protein